MDIFSSNLDVLITGLVGVITTVASGFVSWFFARKKYNSEVDNQLITNMQESLEFYKRLSDDNTERLTKVLEQNKEILEQNAKLLDQNAQLEREVKELKEQVRKLTDKASKNGTSTKKGV